MLNASIAALFIAQLPTHQSLIIEHNPHKDTEASTVGSHLTFKDNYGIIQPDWESDEHRQRAIDTNEMWTLQWYPRNRISFWLIAAPTLSELLSFSQQPR